VAGARDLLYTKNVQTSAGNHGASYSVGTRGSLPEGKAAVV